MDSKLTAAGNIYVSLPWIKVPLFDIKVTLNGAELKGKIGASAIESKKAFIKLTEAMQTIRIRQ